jgi:hypothetical protein
MNVFKIIKKIKFIKDLKLKIIKTETSINLIHQTFLSPYSKQKALELNRYVHLLIIYNKALNKIINGK